MDFKKSLANFIKDVLELELEEVLESMEIPPDKDLGDFAFVCFRLAKALKKNPSVIALEIKESLEKQQIFFLREIKVQGAYINFYIKEEIFAKEVLTEALEKGKDYGKDTIGSGKNVVIDYSSPNIAKPFHVGHLRSTMIGAALYKIYGFLGYNTIGINHLGDWGTQFGKLIVAYEEWGTKETIEKEGIHELNRLYVKFHAEAESDSSLEERARAYMLKMQEGDAKTLSIWQFFYDISMEEFNKIYDRLGVKLDYNTGESFYNDKMEPVLKELTDKGLLEESEGAKIVSLEEFKLPPCMILRSDGGSLYHTRDLAAATYRYNTFNFDKALYVTATDQSLHFTQLFKVLGKMGYEFSKNMTHVPFGLVSLETGKLSTRKGNVVLMESLLDEAENKVLDIIKEKNPNLENKEEVAKKIGIGAIVFNDLYNSRIKDVVFSWSHMLNFDGETGPYVQYTHARACSLLEKSGITDFDNVDFSLLTDSSSINLVRLVYFFKDKIHEAAMKNEPFVITRHVVDIAQSFNRFYHNNQVLVEDIELKRARLALTYVCKNIIKSGFWLIGIDTPTKM